MKYISFAIPCYNSEAYMEKAINSILVGGEDVEILVVNDGSRDGTQKIAERYQEKYPTIEGLVRNPQLAFLGASIVGYYFAGLASIRARPVCTLF